MSHHLKNFGWGNLPAVTDKLNIRYIRAEIDDMSRPKHPNKNIEEAIQYAESNKKVKFYHFVLVLSGLSEPNESIENALFEAGCDDALLIFRDNVPILEFDRQAINFEKAVFSAILDVESANLGLKVLRVESEHVVPKNFQSICQNVMALFNAGFSQYHTEQFA